MQSPPPAGKFDSSGIQLKIKLNLHSAVYCRTQQLTRMRIILVDRAMPPAHDARVAAICCARLRQISSQKLPRAASTVGTGPKQVRHVTRKRFKPSQLVASARSTMNRLCATLWFATLALTRPSPSRGHASGMIKPSAQANPTANNPESATTSPMGAAVTVSHSKLACTTQSKP